jgi:hypothetical protein
MVMFLVLADRDKPLFGTSGLLLVCGVGLTKEIFGCLGSVTFPHGVSDSVKETVLKLG